MLKIKRWYLMLSGKSLWHVNQDVGKHFSKSEVRGYYNNMTEKVTMIPELMGNNNLPRLNIEGGKFTFFPVAIFQYGLGCYDLFLETNDSRYLDKFFQCVNWTMEHQDTNGRWNNFSHYCPNSPYSSMAQGEAASLLVRAFVQTHDYKYLDAAKKGLSFMLLPIEEGGTTKYDNDDVFLMEYTFKGMVLNGSIFSWWGLYDYVLASNDNGIYKIALDNSLNTLVKVLEKYDCNYWSMYSEDGLIASPFYHNLHIAQMQAMFQLTDIPIFDIYANLWIRYQKNPFYKSIAFVKKSIQKILE